MKTTLKELWRRGGGLDATPSALMKLWGRFAVAATRQSAANLKEFFEWRLSAESRYASPREFLEGKARNLGNDVINRWSETRGLRTRSCSCTLLKRGLVFAACFNFPPTILFAVQALVTDALRCA